MKELTAITLVAVLALLLSQTMKKLSDDIRISEYADFQARVNSGKGLGQ